MQKHEIQSHVASPSPGPRFVRLAGGEEQEVIYPGEQEVAGVELWITPDESIRAGDMQFVIRPTDQQQRVFVQIRGECRLESGDIFVAGRQRFLFEQRNATTD